MEDTIVAIRPARMFFPFTVPESIRPLNPAFPMGSTVGFSNIDPLTGQALTTPTINYMHNFGHEYLWHCHILSHEEADMMRPIVLDPNTKADILWRKSSDGQNKLWYLDGVTRVGPEETIDTEPDLNWKVVGRGGFNGDGKTDILWRNSSNGENKVWFMNLLVKIGEAPLDPPIVSNQNWQIVG